MKPPSSWSAEIVTISQHGGGSTSPHAIDIDGQGCSPPGTPLRHAAALHMLAATSSGHCSELKATPFAVVSVVEWSESESMTHAE